MFKSLLVSIGLVVWGTSVFACYAPPQHLTTSARDLVQRSDAVVLAQVTGRAAHRRPRGANILGPVPEFEVLEGLKGEMRDSFALNTGVLRGAARGPRDFDQHRSRLFWDKFATRQGNDAACRVVPEFSVGRTYLVFLGEGHWRGYEEIRDPDDLWLRDVRYLVENPHTEKGFPVPFEDWFSMAHSNFVASVKSCETYTFSVEQVISGRAGRTWRSTRNRNYILGYLPGCEEGKRYLVMSLSSSRRELPFYSSTLIPIVNGRADFAQAIENSEMNVTGAVVRTIDELLLMEGH